MRLIVKDILSVSAGYGNPDYTYDYTDAGTDAGAETNADADAYIARLKQRLRKRPQFGEEITNWTLDALESDEDAIMAEANIADEDQKIKELIDLADDGPEGTLPETF
ncbi:MAG: hypothetical protein HQK89_12870 [Nitrospirae bacterium]|nr:hypothetical protein [Nitrospirota bacterium]